MDQTYGGLLRKCNEAIRAGADFPTVWQTVLKPHRLVRGLPESHLEEGDDAQLRIRLVTGQWLIFDSGTKSFSLT